MLRGSSLAIDMVPRIGISDVDIPGSINRQTEQGRPQGLHRGHQLISPRIEDEEVPVWNFWLFHHINGKSH